MRAVLLAVLFLLMTVSVAPTVAAVPCEGRPGDYDRPVGVYQSSQGDSVIFVGTFTHNGHWWGTEYPISC